MAGDFEQTLRGPQAYKITRKAILTVDKMVFVNLGEDGLPAAHGRTEIKYIQDQFPDSAVE